eukprot:190398-Pleurochrysis_carterae.AAC.1
MTPHAHPLGKLVCAGSTWKRVVPGTKLSCYLQCGRPTGTPTSSPGCNSSLALRSHTHFATFRGSRAAYGIKAENPGLFSRE